MITNNNVQINLAALHPGTIVSTGQPGFRHYGVITGSYINGWPTVISNTGKFRMVVEEPLALFHEQSDLRVEGYWGVLPPHEVLARARAKLGSPYSILTSNCEHFVRFVHGIEPESPQIQLAVAGAILLGLLIGLSRA